MQYFGTSFFFCRGMIYNCLVMTIGTFARDCSYHLGMILVVKFVLILKVNNQLLNDKQIYRFFHRADLKSASTIPTGHQGLDQCFSIFWVIETNCKLKFSCRTPKQTVRQIQLDLPKFTTQDTLGRQCLRNHWFTLQPLKPRSMVCIPPCSFLWNSQLINSVYIKACVTSHLLSCIIHISLLCALEQ